MGTSHCANTFKPSFILWSLFSPQLKEVIYPHPRGSGSTGWSILVLMIKGKASQAGWTGSGIEVGRRAKSTGTYREFEVTGHWVYSHIQNGRRL